MEAATEFVLMMLQEGQSQWPSVCSGLEPLEPRFASFRDDILISYEFMLACTAVQMHALPNLLKSEQARRIRSYILECLTNDKFGSYGPDAIAGYDAMWNDYSERAHPPYNGVASLLFTKLGLSTGVTIGDTTYKDPVLLLALGGTIVRFAGGWWKNYVQQHEIVP